MFDAVLAKANTGRRRLGTGAAASVATYAALFGVALWLSGTRAPEQTKEPDLTFFAVRPPAPAPALIRGGGDAKKPTPVVKKKNVLVAPTVVPIAKPPEADPKKDDTVTGEPIGEAKVGVVGGCLDCDSDPTSTCVGPQCTGAPGGPNVPEVYPFGAGMTRPELLGGRMPEFTREANEARVSGTMLVKCVITTEGRLTNCRVIRPVSFMTEEVLAALATQRYSPVTFNGTPVSVDYLFTFRFVPK
jgi:periplasmic protein TonB